MWDDALKAIADEYPVLLVFLFLAGLSYWHQWKQHRTQLTAMDATYKAHMASLDRRFDEQTKAVERANAAAVVALQDVVKVLQLERDALRKERNALRRELGKPAADEGES